MDEKYIEDLFSKLGGESKFGSFADFKDLMQNDAQYRKDFHSTIGEKTLGKFGDFETLVKKNNGQVSQTGGQELQNGGQTTTSPAQSQLQSPSKSEEPKVEIGVPITIDENEPTDEVSLALNVKKHKDNVLKSMGQERMFDVYYNKQKQSLYEQKLRESGIDEKAQEQILTELKGIPDEVFEREFIIESGEKVKPYNKPYFSILRKENYPYYINRVNGVKNDYNLEKEGDKKASNQLANAWNESGMKDMTAFNKVEPEAIVNNLNTLNNYTTQATNIITNASSKKITGFKTTDESLNNLKESAGVYIESNVTPDTAKDYLSNKIDTNDLKLKYNQQDLSSIISGQPVPKQDLDEYTLSSIKSKLDPNSVVDQMVFNVYSQKVALEDAFQSATSIEDAAMSYRKSLDPEFSGQIDALEGNVNRSTRGQTVDAFISDPAVLEYAKKDPTLYAKIVEAKMKFNKDFPEYAKSKLLQKIGSVYQKEYANAFANNPTTDKLDIIVDKLLKEGQITEEDVNTYKTEIAPKQKWFWKTVRGLTAIVGGLEWFKEDIVPVGDLSYGIYEGIYGTIHKGAGTVEQGLKFVPGIPGAIANEVFSDKAVIDRALAERTTAQVDPIGWGGTMYQIGEVTGFAATLAMMGIPAGAMGLGAEATHMLTTTLAFYGENKKEALLKIPGNTFADEVQRQLLTGSNTAIDLYLTKFLDINKISKGALNLLKKDVSNVVGKLRTGEITQAKAGEEVWGKIKDFGVRFGANSMKNATVMNSFTAAHDAVYKLFDAGGKELPEIAEEYINNFIPTLKSTVLLNLFSSIKPGEKITVGKTLFDMAKNPEYYREMINKKYGDNPKLQGEKEELLNNLNEVTAINQNYSDPIFKDLTEAQKQKILLLRMQANIYAKKATSTQDPTASKSFIDKSNELSKQIEVITKGKDKASEHEVKIEPTKQAEQFLLKGKAVTEKEFLDAVKNDPNVEIEYIGDNEKYLQMVVDAGGVRREWYEYEDAIPEVKTEVEKLTTQIKAGGKDSQTAQEELERLKQDPKQYFIDKNNTETVFKIEEYDKKNTGGVSGAVGEGQASKQAEPIKGGSTETTGAGGVLQTPGVEGEGEGVEQKVGEVEPLKDVESTTSALSNEISGKTINEIKLKIPLSSDYDLTNPKEISEAYHKAKADGTNPKLIKAVEDLIGKKREVPKQKTVEQLRAEEKAEYEAMPDPTDKVKRQEIYDKYDKLITPLLKEGVGEAKAEVPQQKLEEGATVELPPQVKGGVPRQMIYKEGVWQQQVGGQTTKVSENVQKQAQAQFESSQPKQKNAGVGEVKAEVPKEEKKGFVQIDKNVYSDGENNTYVVPTSSSEAAGTHIEIDKSTYDEWKKLDDVEKKKAESIKNSNLSESRKSADLKANAMSFAAEKRKVLGTSTANELSKIKSNVNKIQLGDNVNVNGVEYTVQGFPYGKIKLSTEGDNVKGEITVESSDNIIKKMAEEKKASAPKIEPKGTLITDIAKHLEDKKAKEKTQTELPKQKGKAEPVVTETKQSGTEPKAEVPKHKKIAEGLLSVLGLPTEETESTNTEFEDGVKPQFKIDLNENLSADQAGNVKKIFDAVLDNKNSSTSETVNIEETIDPSVPTQKIVIEESDKRPESKLMSKLRISLNYLLGKSVGLGMSDTLTTGERTVDVMNPTTGKVEKKTIREEGGIGYPFKSLMDLINGQIEKGKKIFGWASVGEGAGSAMINAAKKANKITGKELKQHYFDSLNLSEEQKKRIDEAIPDNKEYGLVSIYKMGNDGILSNEAHTREAFRQIETSLTNQEKELFFKLAKERLNKLKWEGKEQYIEVVNSANNFVELENILHGKDSKLPLGSKASIIQNVFLSTEKTTSTETGNKLAELLKSKGISIESVSRAIEEPAMNGIDKGQPMVLLAIDPDSKVIEDKNRERHKNYPYGVEGFPIGVFNETTQMHHLSPEMMDNFVKTATTIVDENAKRNGQKVRVSIFQNADGKFYAQEGTGVDKFSIKNKKGIELSGNTKEELLDKLKKEKYKLSQKIIDERYTQKINGVTFNNLLQKAKTGFISIFESPKLSAQEKLVKFLQKAFPGISVEINSSEYKKLEEDFKAQKLFNKDGKSYGFVKDGRIYLNPEYLNNNTSIHEFSHIWNAFAKNYKPEIYSKGVDLITGTKYHDYVLNDSQYQKLIKAEFGSDAIIKDKTTGKFIINEKSENADAIKETVADEALAKAIGDKGELFVNEAQKIAFVNWLNTLYQAIKQIAGFESMTPEQFQNLDINQFVDAALKDILSGKKVSDITSKDLSQITKQSTKFSLGTNESKIKDYIESQRKAGESEQDIRIAIASVAKKIGLTLNEIDQLMGGKKPSEVPPAVPPTGETKKTAPEEDPEMTKMANAVNDAFVEGRFGTDVLDNIIAKLQDTDVAKIYNTVKEKIKSGIITAKDVRDKIITTKEGSEADQAVLMYDLAELKGKEAGLMNEMINESDPAKQAEIAKKIMDVQNEMQDNALANRYLGRTASSIFRLRQLWVNRGMDLATMEKQYMSSKGLKSLTPEQSKEIKEAYNQIAETKAKLEKTKAEVDALIQENERVKAENEKLKELKDQSVAKEKEDRNKKASEKLSASAERVKKIKDNLRGLRGNMSSGVDPKIAIEIGKLAAEKFYQGAVKLDVLVKDILDDVKDIFPDWTENDVRNHLFPNLKNASKYFTEEKDYTSSKKELKDKISQYKALQSEYAKTLFEWQKNRRTDLMDKRPWSEKLADRIYQWQRFSVLSYPTTFVKLAAVVGHNLLLKPFKFGYQKVIANIAKMISKDFAGKMGVYGDPSLKAMAKYYSEFIRNFSVANLKEHFSGIDTKEILYGDKFMYDEWSAGNGLLEMPGRSHGYIKSFVKNPEFQFAHEMLTGQAMTKMAEIGKKMEDKSLTPSELEALKGEYDKYDVTNEEVLMRINKLALEHGKDAILMGDNKTVDKFRELTKGSGAASTFLKTEAPIVKIPLNYISRALLTKYGLIQAITGKSFGAESTQHPSVAKLIFKGTEGLTEAQGQALSKAIMYGSMGATMFALGYYNKDKVKLNEDGSIEFNGMHISKNLVHVPEFESFFSGVETAHKFKDEKSKFNWIESFLLSDMEILKKNPFLNMLEYGVVGGLVNALTDKKMKDESKVKLLEDAVTNKVINMAVPGFSKQMAQWTDTEEGEGIHPMGTPIKRKPQGNWGERFVQSLEMAIPGLRQLVPTGEGKKIFDEKQIADSGILKRYQKLGVDFKEVPAPDKLGLDEPLTPEQYDKFIEAYQKEIKLELIDLSEKEFEQTVQVESEGEMETQPIEGTEGTNIGMLSKKFSESELKKEKENKEYKKESALQNKVDEILSTAKNKVLIRLKYKKPTKSWVEN